MMVILLIELSDVTVLNINLKTKVMKKGILLFMVTVFAVSVSAQNRNRYTESKNENYREASSSRSSRGQSTSNYNKQTSSRETKDLDRFTDRDYVMNNKKKSNQNNNKHYNTNKNNYSKNYNNKKYEVNYSKNYSHGVVVCNDYSRRVKYLPNNFVRVRFTGISLFFTDGIFYKSHGGYYQEVIPPVGAVVYQLPLYAERVSIDGRIYYEFHNTLFKKIETNHGYAFEVVGQLNWN